VSCLNYLHCVDGSVFRLAATFGLLPVFILSIQFVGARKIRLRRLPPQIPITASATPPKTKGIRLLQIKQLNNQYDLQIPKQVRQATVAHRLLLPMDTTP
jgi:hypothetical protein